MGKPLKSWEPKYRFGGLKGSLYLPQPLGTRPERTVIKTPKKRK